MAAASSESVREGGPSGGPPPAAACAQLAEVRSPAAVSAEEGVFLADALPQACELDALPYVDPLPSEQQQEVQRLIQEEMAAIAKERREGEVPSDYLSNFPVPQTPLLDDAGSLLGKEMVRKANGEPIPELDLSMYTTFSRPSGSKASDPKEWEKAVANCQRLLQHTAVSHLNLELMNAHAAASWQTHLNNLSRTKERYAAAVKRRAEESDRICKARKMEQVEAATTLKQLDETAAQYITNNAAIMEALGPLTAEVNDLKANCRMRGILPEYAEEDEFDLEGWKEASGMKT